MKTVILPHAYSPRRSVSALLSLSRVAALPLLWAQRLQERRELRGLLGAPDYLIKDVGLQRDQIARESVKPFWLA
jgi:uncharacterized protein YjiS (DUF1127 family)